MVLHTVPIVLPVGLSDLLPGLGATLRGTELTARDSLWLAAGIAEGMAFLIVLGLLYGSAITSLPHIV